MLSESDLGPRPWVPALRGGPAGQAPGQRKPGPAPSSLGLLRTVLPCSLTNLTPAPPFPPWRWQFQGRRYAEGTPSPPSPEGMGLGERLLGMVMQVVTCGAHQCRSAWTEGLPRVLGLCRWHRGPVGGVSVCQNSLLSRKGQIYYLFARKLVLRKTLSECVQETWLYFS